MKFLWAITMMLWAGLAAAQDADARRIVVTGEGAATMPNDAAVLRLGVESTAGSAAEALAGLSTDLQAVIDAMQSEGVEAAQIATAQLSLFERQDNGSSISRLPGQVTYVASSVLSVTTGDVDSIGAVLDAAVESGANRIDGVSFDVSDPAAALDQARRMAVADGIAKAQVLAEAAGVTLGDLMILRDAPGGGPELGVSRMSVPVMAGSGGLSVTVEMVFAING